MNIHDLEKELLEVNAECERLGLIWASDKSLYEALEDKKKVVLARACPLEGSEASKDREAYKSEAYSDYLLGLAVAREKSNYSYVKYSAVKDKFEAMRSILSNRRTEIQRGL